MKNDRGYLILLLLISFPLSLYLFFRTYVISLDGAFQYIPLAKAFGTGTFREALRTTGQQPLYPFLMALASSLIPDMEIAGRLVASLMGLLLVFPLYFLGKQLFNQRVAFLSTLLLALHPSIRRFSADVLKESTYLFFLAMALWLTWRTLHREEKFSFLLIPLWSLPAYLVRPDGVEVLLVTFFYIFWAKPFSKPLDRWIALSFLSLSALVLSLPYLLSLKEITGEWTLSKTKSIFELFGLGGEGDRPPLLDRGLFALKKVNQEVVGVYHPLYLLLLLLGGLSRRSNLFRNGEGFLFFCFVLHYVILFLLALNITVWGNEGGIQAFHFSGRHVLPLLLFSIYWVGFGLEAFSKGLRRKVESNGRLSHLSPKTRGIFLWTTLLMLITAILLPKTLKPQRYERLPEKWAGIWIKEHLGRGKTLFTTIPRVAYYAEGGFEFLDLDRIKIEQAIGWMKERNGFYLVLREREAQKDPSGWDALREGFVELGRFGEESMEKVIVYRRNP
ncbi:MAG: glycosyltransferase family 39 protein [Desulfobacterota bacterium]|nr:glycosyltransferase family 39 protein [Thermodesulfobacteriota bacterium]